MSTDTSNDELKAEYDLSTYKVRSIGEGRKLMNQIQLDVDVERVFPDSASVNEALRFLIRVTEENKADLPTK